MRAATSFLYMSWLDVGSCDMAVSASRARFCNQFCCLVCRLYVGPFCSSDISCSVNVMSVLFNDSWIKGVVLFWCYCLCLN